jgi:fatty acid-binding protein DegV
VVTQKDRELARMRSIHAIRLGQAKAGGWDPTQKVRKREKSVQTVIGSVADQNQERETYGFVQDIDMDMLRSEKQAFLRYMRHEVVQN